MSKVRVVVFVQDGLVVDVITDSSKEIEYFGAPRLPPMVKIARAHVGQRVFQDIRWLRQANDDGQKHKFSEQHTN